MNGYERIMNAIAGKPVDMVPVWPFVMTFAAKYTHTPYGKFASDYHSISEALIKTTEDFSLDAVTVDSDAYREASACGAELVFPEDDLPYIKKSAIEDPASFSFPEIRIEDSPRLLDKIYGVQTVKNYFGRDKAVCGWIEAPLQCAGTLYSMEDYMSDIFDNSSFVEELLEYVTEMDIRFAVMQAEAGADLLGVGDAMASLVSPSCYEEIFLPYTTKLVNGIRAKTDVKLKYHICGNSRHLWKYAKQIGFDIVQIDYPVKIEEAIAAVGDSVCVKGNLNPMTLLSGPIDKITADTRKILEAKNNRFILSPGCEVCRDTPVENFRTFVNMRLY